MSRRKSNSVEVSRAISRCYQRVLLGMAPLLVFYLLCQMSSGHEAFYTSVNSSVPVCLMIALLMPVYGLLRRVPESIWAPAAWLPISFAVFYGFGPLVAIYGDDATLWYMASTNLAASQVELFRANMLSTVGISLVVAGFWYSERLRVRRLRRGSGDNYAYVFIKPAQLALAFVVLGGALRYGLLNPAAWAAPAIVIPGAIAALGHLVDVGYALLTFAMITTGQHKLRLVFWVTWPFHLFLCALSLAKVELIAAMLLPTLGAFLAHRSRKRFAVSAAVMALIYAVSQPWVHFGRDAIHAQTGTITQAGYVERIDLLVRYVSEERRGGVRQEETQGWWTRLNFSGVQAYAMHAYDNGQSGSTLSNAWMYFIPRFIWPGKPVMEGPGKAFHAMVTGGEGTSFLALSVFGDLYWQFGWLGVIVVCPLIGSFFASLSWRSISIMRTRQFIMLPVVLLALDTALLGMNKYLSNGIIGIIPIYYGYLMAIRFATRLLGGPKRHRRTVLPAREF